MLLSDYQVVNEKGEITCERIYPVSPLVSSDLSLLNEIPFDLFMYGVAYNREIFKKIEYRQTEGIPYTDCEWMFLPMTQVQTFVRIPEVVYSYLLGREGQSVARDVITKQISLQTRVFLNNVETYIKYRERWNKSVDFYAKRQLIQLGNYIYSAYLLSSTLRNRIKIDLPCIDAKIENDVREVYCALLRKYVLFRNCFFTINIGRLFMSYKRFRTLLALFIQTYAKFRMKVKKFGC